MRDGRAARLEALREGLLALRKSIEEEAARQLPRIDAALPKHRLSAANLAHYLALRKQDIRPLQLELAALGLSSLARCEGHVLDTLLRLCAWLSNEGGEAHGRGRAA
jgi:pyruvate kinase